MNFVRFTVAPMRGAALGMLCLAAIGGVQPVQAQRPSMSSEMTALYGRGVHSYFAGQAQEADRQFTEVINAGATDPRVYYFRAMARARCGYDAESDMRTGAEYEAQDPGAASEVGQALARIQGPQRQLLEQYRRQARIDRVQQVQLQSRDLYEQRQSREADVLRRPRPIDLGDLPPAAPESVASPPASPPATPEAAPPTPQPRLTPDVPPATPGSPFDEPATPPPALDEFGGTQPTPPSEQFDQEVPPVADPAPFADPAETPPDAGPSATPDIGPDAPMEPPAIEDDGFGDAPGTPIESEAEAEADGDLPFGESPADPAAAADEPAADSSEPAAASSEPEKMSGILGRVFQRAVTPSNLPDLSKMIPPMGPGGPAPEGAQPPFSAPPAEVPPAETPFGEQPAPFGEEPQPFGEPAPESEPDAAPAAEPTPEDEPANAATPDAFGEAPDAFGEPPAEVPPAEAPPAEEPATPEPADDPAADEANPFE